MRDSYLAGKDDDFVDRPSSLVLQELANDETAKGASSDNGEIFVPGHLCRLDSFAERTTPPSSYLSLHGRIGI
jgi:hypothetical protein